jgi:hypothetical protein
MSEPLVILTSRTKAAQSIAASLLLVAIGLGIVLWDQDAMDVAMGWAAILFFGACAVYSAARFVKPTTAVVIDSTGVYDTSTWFGAGFLAWEDIAEMRPFISRRQSFLVIIPKDLDAFLARQPLWKRLSMRLDLLLGWPAARIPETVLPMTVVELLRLIDRRFKPSAE